MSEFQGKRVTHQYLQTNNATPDKVFPLLCPVREAEWVPGWKYRLIYSNSGVAERGCIFTTPNDDGSETTWVITEYDPGEFRIGFVWNYPGLVAAQIQIRLEESDDRTIANIQYTYTGLSEAGNREVERYDQTWFQSKMKSWEAAINYYLQNGRVIQAETWE
jgi:hypothetical protein